MPMNCLDHGYYYNDKKPERDRQRCHEDCLEQARVIVALNGETANWVLITAQRTQWLVEFAVPPPNCIGCGKRLDEPSGV